ncbi:(2Fe-2S)-binding protein [Ferrovibrio sp.]|uniref:(2Fe-2S)-binding protein n=1 Tax=Ferrovibrio sp. TaxID=1917215 RepID=UPI0026334582|nr:(2Fe-2S)-binding protein [Ferrovibrio sp.]
MFKRMQSPVAPEQDGFELCVDGTPITAQNGETVALAMLNAGIVPFRHTAVSGQARAPLCLMGVCFDCMVEIDGRLVQSCMVDARPGMRVTLLTGARDIGAAE